VFVYVQMTPEIRETFSFKTMKTIAELFIELSRRRVST